MARRLFRFHRDGLNHFEGWRLAVLVFVVVAIFSVAAAAVARRIVDRQIEARLALNGDVLVTSVRDGMEDVEHYLEALAGVFLASEEVTFNEYELYAESVGLQSGMLGIAYVRIVDASDLGEFEERTASVTPGYRVFEFDAEGNRISVQPRARYFPIQFFEPSTALERPMGLDAGSPPGRLPFILKAIASGSPIATPLVPLATTGEEGFIIYAPVVDRTGTVRALVASPVSLTGLMADRIPRGLASSLTWAVRDTTDLVTPELSDGRITPPAAGGLVYTSTFQAAGRSWRFEVRPAPGSQLLAGRRQTQWILVTGLVLALVAAVASFALSHRAAALRQIEALTAVITAKEQFVASVAHELRTPLTGILGFAELLRSHETEVSSEERTEFIAAIADDASDVTALVEDLIVLGRVEHGSLLTAGVPTDLEAESVHTLEALNLANRISVDVDQAVGYVMADPERIRQIIRNLVKNAVAYGGANIRLTIKEMGEMLVLEVIDDGAGVSQDRWERSLEQYFRGHDHSGMPDSIGLGLKVSRTLAQRMGGELSYRRVAGETVFSLTFPASLRYRPARHPGEGTIDALDGSTRA